MAYKISGNIIIDNNGDIRNVGVATIGLIDGKVSEKAITEQTAGTESDVTGADEILLYDSATNGLLRVTVDEFIGGSGIGTIVTEFEQLTVTGITTVGFLTASNIFVSGIVTSANGFVGNLTGDVAGNTTGDHNGDVYSRDGTQLVLEVPTPTGTANYIGTVTGDTYGTHNGDVFGNTTGNHNGDVYTADGATKVVDTANTPNPLFIGDAEGLSGNPNISVNNVSVAGSITVAAGNTYYGDGSGLTGIGNSLGGLTDTNIPTPEDGQALVYDSTGKEWVAGLAPAFELDANNNVYVPDLTGTPPFTTGANNTLIGLDAGTNITSSSNNVFFGPNAGKSFSIGNDNVAIGNSALPVLDGSIANVVIGVSAGRDITGGSSNTIIGNNAAAETVGSLRNVFLGTLAGGGFGGGPDNLTDNVAIGQQAAAGIKTDTAETVYIGALAGSTPTGVTTGSVYVGSFSGNFHGEGSCIVAVGAFAGLCASGNSNVFIGRSAGANIIGNDNLYAGTLAGFGTATNLSTGDSNQNIGLGGFVHRYIDSGDRNIAIGYGGQYRITTGSNNNSLGAYSLFKISTGTDNLAVGSNSLCELTTGIGNVGLGFNALRALTTGSRNVAIGDGSGFNIIGSAQENTIVGTLNYLFNTATQGSRNVVIGSRIDAPAGNLDDQLAIGNGTNRWITGDANYDVTIPNDLTVVGTVTAFSFTGDGSALTGVATALGNLSDVDLTGLQDGEVIKYDLASDTWVPGVGPAFNIDANSNVYAEELIGTPAFTTGSCNTIIGKDAGCQITTASGNVIFGKDAGAQLRSGGDNVILGTRAANNLGNPGSTFDNECNIAIGSNALERADDALGNVAIGISAMSNATDYTNNVVIGTFALNGTTNSNSIDSNIVFGALAAECATSTAANPVGDNVIIGSYAAQFINDARFNTIIGNQAGQNMKAGSSQNLLFGSVAGRDIGGTCNIALGRGALAMLGSGAGDVSNNSIAIGAYTQLNLQNGQFNVTIGDSSGQNLVTGNANTFMGACSGCDLVVGAFNNIFGTNSGSALTNANDNNVMGAYTMRNVTTGTYNTVFGNYSGNFLTGGSSRNLIMGSVAVNSGTAGVSNDNVVIGYGIELPVGDCQLLIGNTTNRWITGDSNFDVTIPNSLTAGSIISDNVTATVSISAPGLPTRESGSTSGDQVIKTINMSTENVHKVDLVLRQTSTQGVIIDSSSFYYDNSSITAAPPYATKQLNTQITGDINTTGTGFRIQYGVSGSVLTLSILDTQGGGTNPGYDWVLTTTIYEN